MTGLFDSPHERLDWARKAIRDLHIESELFFVESPIRQFAEVDPQTGQELIKIGLTAPLPKIIAQRATEAIDHIRNSFDQSLFAAHAAIGWRSSKSNFPWAQNPGDLERRLRGNRNKTPKIAPDLWPILRSFEPYPRGDAYPGGDDLIREMAHIANRKHTVRLTFAPNVRWARHPSISGSLSAGQSVSIPGPRWDTKKNEMVLASVPRGVQVDYDYKVALYVAFDEAPPLKGGGVMTLLSHFLAKAQSVLEGLAREAATIAKP